MIKEELYLQHNEERTEYYDISTLLSTGSNVFIPFGERSNGKSGAVKDVVLFGCHRNGADVEGCLESIGKHLFLYVRRWKEDTKREAAGPYFDDEFIIEKITKWSDGIWNRIAYCKNREYKLAFYDIDTDKYTYGPIVGYAVGVSEAEHVKSNPKYSKCNFIIFEEFLTNKLYLPNEVKDFESIISTARRKREHEFYVFMIANTVSRLCPYFERWNLHRIFRQKIGTIEVYKRMEIDEDGNEHMTKIGVERCANSSHKSKFILNMSGNDMINDGAWECNTYPCISKPLRDYEEIYEVFYMRNSFKFRMLYLYDPEADTTLWYIEPKTTELKLKADDRLICDWFYPATDWSFDFTPKYEFEKEAFSKLNNFYIIFSDNLTGEEYYQCRSLNIKHPMK